MEFRRVLFRSPVAKISKTNHKEEQKLKANIEAYLPTTIKVKTEKDELINTLCEQIKSQKKELIEQKLKFENLSNELRSIKKENEDLKEHLGVSEKGYMSVEKVEIRKLNEELNKLKVVNKDREEIIRELERTKELLTESLTKNKILENELEAVKEAKKYSEGKVLELQNKLINAEDGYSRLKQEFEQSTFKSEKIKAELEGKISEIQNNIPNKTETSRESEVSVHEVVNNCNSLLKSIKEKIYSEMNHKKGEESAQLDLVNERAKFNDFKRKYEDNLVECEDTIAKSIDEVTRKLDGEKRAELEKKDKIIKELTGRLSQYETTQERRFANSDQVKSLQLQNQQFQKLTNGLKDQISLFGKEQKYLGHIKQRS